MLGEVSRYDLYYYLIHSLKLKFFWLKTCMCLYYLILNFYQINENDDIRIRDHLVIKAVTPC